MAIKRPRLKLLRGSSYTFDVSDSALANHPLKFTADSGSTEYTAGISLTGTQGQAGAELTFTPQVNAPNNLNYYCGTHGMGMGNHVVIPGTPLNVETANFTISSYGSISSWYYSPTNIRSSDLGTFMKAGNKITIKKSGTGQPSDLAAVANNADAPANYTDSVADYFKFTNPSSSSVTYRVYSFQATGNANSSWGSNTESGQQVAHGWDITVPPNGRLYMRPGQGSQKGIWSNVNGSAGYDTGASAGVGGTSQIFIYDPNNASSGVSYDNVYLQAILKLTSGGAGTSGNPGTTTSAIQNTISNTMDTTTGTHNTIRQGDNYWAHRAATGGYPGGSGYTSLPNGGQNQYNPTYVSPAIDWDRGGTNVAASGTNYRLTGATGNNMYGLSGRFEFTSGYVAGANFDWPVIISYLGNRGFHAGGNGSTFNIGYFDITTGANIAYFGDMIGKCSEHGGVGDGARIITMGGYDGTSPGGDPKSDRIQYWTSATTGNAADFGNLVQNKQKTQGVIGDATRAVVGGGSVHASGPPYVTNEMDYVTIQTTGNALDFGDITQARREIGNTNDATRGVFIGGEVTAQVNTIDYITTQTTGNAIDFGDTTNSVYGAHTGICADETRGLYMGGITSPNTFAYNTIEYLTIQTTGNGTDFGDMDNGRSGLSACSNGTTGVIMGGFAYPTGPNVQYMQKVTIQTTGNAVDFGGILQSANSTYGAAGMSGNDA